MQQKFLKKVVGVSSGTPNSFLFLELGVLPIEAEIHKRMLMYLYRILQLPEDDPVTQMFTNLMEMDEKGERNWWTLVKTLPSKYNLPSNLEEIKKLKKNSFKRMVNKEVNNTVFTELKEECSKLKKTADVTYQSFKLQEYWSSLYPNQARLIFKSRCKTLDIRTQNTYKYGGETLCRNCGVHEETFEHVINCGFEITEHVNIDVKQIDVISKILSSTITRVTNRLELFYDKVAKSPETDKSTKRKSNCNGQRNKRLNKITQVNAQLQNCDDALQ